MPKETISPCPTNW